MSGATERGLTRQIVVRIDEDLYADLTSAAERNERTIAQEVRYRLRPALPTTVYRPNEYAPVSPQMIYWWQPGGSPTCGPADSVSYPPDPNVIVTNAAGGAS